MALKTYSGSCHCGAVRFESDIDLSAGTTKCNCSICTKARAWFAIVKSAQFRQIAGSGAQSEYRWQPPGKPAPFLHYLFFAERAASAPSVGVSMNHWADGFISYR
jgi:hypothetical protein